MAGRHRPARVGEAGLDDLFTDGDEISAGPHTRRARLLRVLLPGAAVTAVAYTLSRAIGVAPPLVLLLALVMSGFAIREAAASSHDPRWRRARDVVRPRPPARNVDEAEAADGVLAAVAVWDRRLERARSAPRHAAALLVTQLGGVADERLRQRYGITRGGDPARARAVLGEPTWRVLAGGPAPTDGDLHVVVQRLESL